MRIFCITELPFTEVGKHLFEEVLVPRLDRIGARVVASSASFTTPFIALLGHLPDDAARRAHCRAVLGYAKAQCESAILACDCVLATLDGVDPDDPDMSLIRFAAAAGKPIDGYWSDLRLATENEIGPENPEALELIARSGGFVARSIKELSLSYGGRVRKFLKFERAELRNTRLARRRSRVADARRSPGPERAADGLDQARKPPSWTGHPG